MGFEGADRRKRGRSAECSHSSRCASRRSPCAVAKSERLTPAMPAVTVIDALPRFVTPQEHAEIVSRTPESFASIPSVLRHKQDNVTVSLDPPIAEFNDDNKGSIYVVERLAKNILLLYETHYSPPSKCAIVFHALLSRVLHPIPQDHTACRITQRRYWPVRLLST